jgi:hypothetical protein
MAAYLQTVCNDASTPRFARIIRGGERGVTAIKLTGDLRTDQPYSPRHFRAFQDNTKRFESIRENRTIPFRISLAREFACFTIEAPAELR